MRSVLLSNNNVKKLKDPIKFAGSLNLLKYQPIFYSITNFVI